MKVEVKQFQFNPADYNTTYHVVKKLHSGQTEPLANGEVIVHYIFGWELISLFFALSIYTPKPEDATPADWPQEMRRRYRTALSKLILYIFMVIALIFLAIKFVWELFHVKPFNV